MDIGKKIVLIKLIRSIAILLLFIVIGSMGFLVESLAQMHTNVIGRAGSVNKNTAAANRSQEKMFQHHSAVLQDALNAGYKKDIKAQKELNNVYKPTQTAKSDWNQQQNIRKELLAKSKDLNQSLQQQTCLLAQYWGVTADKKPERCITHAKNYEKNGARPLFSLSLLNKDSSHFTHIKKIKNHKKEVAPVITPKAQITKAQFQPINKEINNIKQPTALAPKSSKATQFIQNSIQSIATSQSVSASSSDFGIVGPLSVFANYSANLGASVTAKWAQKLGGSAAMALDGEYGPNQQRINATLGQLFGKNNMLKITGEYLRQKLDFSFDSGAISQWVGQQAYGAMYTYVLPHNSIFLAGITADVSYSMASSKDLATKYFHDTGGAAYANFRRIAGGVDEHADLGVNVLRQFWTSVNLAVNYDVVKYATKYNKISSNTRGFGAVIGLQQLITHFTKLQTNLNYNKAYQDYKVELDQLFPFNNSQLQLSLSGEHLLTAGSGDFSRDNRVQLGASYSFGMSGKSKGYDLGGSLDSSQDLLNWTETPAVYMPQVLAVADQKSVALPYFDLTNMSYEKGAPVDVDISSEVHAGKNQRLVSVVLSSVITTLHTTLDTTLQTVKIIGNAPKTPGATTINITAVNDGGVSQTGSFKFVTTDHPVPKIAALSEYSGLLDSGNNSGTRELTITGKNFMPGFVAKDAKATGANKEPKVLFIFGDKTSAPAVVDASKTNDEKIVISEIPKSSSIGRATIEVINSEGLESIDKVTFAYNPLHTTTPNVYRNDDVIVTGGGFVKDLTDVEFLNASNTILKTASAKVLDDGRGTTDKTKIEFTIPDEIPNDFAKVKVINHNADKTVADSGMLQFAFGPTQNILTPDPDYSMLSGGRRIILTRTDGAFASANPTVLVGTTHVKGLRLNDTSKLQFISPSQDVASHPPLQVLNPQVTNTQSTKLKSSNIVHLNYYDLGAENTGLIGHENSPITITGYNFENPVVTTTYNGKTVGEPIYPKVSTDKKSITFAAPKDPDSLNRNNVDVTFTVTNYADAEHKIAEDKGQVMFTYNAGSITTITPPYSLVGGHRIITIKGSDFGSNPDVLVDGKLADKIGTLQDNAVQFYAPEHLEATANVQVIPKDKSAKVKASNVVILHYYKLASDKVDGRKGIPITIHASGTDYTFSNVRVFQEYGTEETEVLDVKESGDHKTVTFTAPKSPDPTSSNQVGVYFKVVNYTDKDHASLEDSGEVHFFYNPSSDLEMTPNVSLVSGGRHIKLTGQNFGTHPDVMFDGAPLPDSDYLGVRNNNEIQFKAKAHSIEDATVAVAPADKSMKAEASIPLHYYTLTNETPTGTSGTKITIKSSGTGYSFDHPKVKMMLNNEVIKTITPTVNGSTLTFAAPETPNPTSNIDVPVKIKVINYTADDATVPEDESALMDFTYKPGTVNTMSPHYSLVSGKRIITITGSDFGVHPKVQVGTEYLPESELLSSSPTEIKFKAPEYSDGENNPESVIVYPSDRPTSGAVGATLPQELYFYQLQSNTPEGVIGSRISISSTGADYSFENPRIVEKDNAAAGNIITSFECKNDNEHHNCVINGNAITFDAPDPNKAIPVDAGLSVTFTVTNYSGEDTGKIAEDSGDVGFTYKVAVPTITTFSPAARMPDGTREITVEGTNFNIKDGDEVYVGSLTAAPIVAKVNSATELTFESKTLPTKKYRVYVKDLKTGATSPRSSMQLKYAKVSGLSSGYVGQPLTITGADFENVKVSICDLDGVTNCKVVTPSSPPTATEFKFDLPANTHASDNVSFKVENYKDQGQTQLEDHDSFGFNYVSPLNISIDPGTRLRGGDVMVTVTNHNGPFPANSEVYFDNTKESVTGSGNQLTFKAPSIPDDCPNNACDVYVQSGSEQSNHQSLKYIPLSPASFSGDPDAEITINGAGFDVNTTITTRFNNQTKDFSGNKTINSDSEMMFKVPTVLDNNNPTAGGASGAQFVVFNKRGDYDVFMYNYNYAYITCPTIEQVSSSNDYKVLASTGVKTFVPDPNYSDKTGTITALYSTYRFWGKDKWITRLYCIYVRENVPNNPTPKMFTLYADVGSPANPQLPFRGGADQNKRYLWGTPTSYYCESGSNTNNSSCQYRFIPAAQRKNRR